MLELRLKLACLCTSFINIKKNIIMSDVVETNPENPFIHNNQWYRINTSSSVVMVFVHGFFSNANECWKSETGEFWPDLICKDSRFESPSIFMAGYFTDIDSEDYNIADCAREIYDEISRVSENGEFAPIQAENIIFVCHSLGGIVTRYILESRYSCFAKKSVGIVLMASPSLGSTYADVLSLFSKIYKNKLGAQLKFMNDSLIDLDRRFKDLIEQKHLNLVGAEAIEHKALIGSRWLPPLKPIVSELSASRYFGNSKKLANTNHSTIVKPTDLKHPSHLFLVDFFNNKFRPIIKNTANKPISKASIYAGANGIPSVKNTNLVLFDVLCKNNIDYYLPRDFDDELAGCLALRSVWVSGPSGCGKTSAIRYFLEKNNEKPLDICLSHCVGEITRDTYIAEIVSTANQLGLLGVTDRQLTYHALVDLLTNYSASFSIVLYLDEIPVSGVETSLSISTLLNLISDLLNSVKQRSLNSDLRFVISSIYKPNIILDGKREKLPEFLKTMSLNKWSDSELAALYQLIVSHVPELSLVTDEELSLVAASKGSPRFLKTFLRNYLTSSLEGNNFNEVLAKTKNELAF